jgi:transcriptional regulator GlxA family with amidase domain
MLALSGLPERTFKRRFKVAAGYAPIEYVQAVRIEEAKQLLETTGAPTDADTHLVDYDDPARYRQRFQSITHLNEEYGRQVAKQPG